MIWSATRHKVQLHYSFVMGRWSWVLQTLILLTCGLLIDFSSMLLVFTFISELKKIEWTESDPPLTANS